MIPSQNFFRLGTVGVGIGIVGLMALQGLRPKSDAGGDASSTTLAWEGEPAGDFEVTASGSDNDQDTFGTPATGQGVSEFEGSDAVVGSSEDEFSSFASNRTDGASATMELTANRRPSSMDNLSSGTPADFKDSGSSFQMPSPQLSVGSIGGAAPGDRQPSSPPRVSSRPAAPVLNVGRIGSAPRREQVLSIDRLPDSESEVRRAFQAAAGRANRILPPGGDVAPPLQRSGGQSGTMGRTTAITIGLQLSPGAGAKLPSAVRTQVERYFEDHRLAVQPIIYHDADGQPYFGTDTASAFFRMDRPARTLEPESMIQQAVARFRTLGVVSDVSSSLNATSRVADSSAGRTLAMAFAFSQSIGSSVNAPTRTVYELLLLHLPASSSLAAGGNGGQDVVSLGRGDVPEINVFITSDNRTVLHRVLGDPRLAASGGPAISASVRFDDMTMLGLYPAKPVVTDMDYRRGGSISMSIVDRFIDASTPVSLPAILDRFTDLAKAPIMTEDPIEKLRRQRLRQLDQVINPTTDAPGKF